MPNRVIVIGGSAGAFSAMKEITPGLAPGLPAPVFVVLHRNSGNLETLPQFFSRLGPLPAVHPSDGDPIVPGQIYLAPPDYHMILEPHRVRLTRGPRENGFRPSVDPLFRSAAAVFGAAAIGVVLSGLGDDGTAGLIAIKLHGGTTVVQDPLDAPFREMPRTAMKYLKIDHCLGLQDIAPTLVRLVNHAPNASLL